MKPIQAWAVVDSAGQLAVNDCGLPLYWRRSPAKADMYCRVGDGGRIIRVEVLEVARSGAHKANTSRKKPRKRRKKEAI